MIIQNAELSNFLNALYASHDAPIPAYMPGEDAITYLPAENTVEFLDKTPGVYVLPGEDTLCFFTDVIETSDPDAWRGRRLPPQAVLHNGGTMILLTCPYEPVPVGDPRIQALMKAWGMMEGEGVPVPGGDWSLVHVDTDGTAYELEQLEAALLSQSKGDDQQTTASNPEQLHDAKIITPYNPEDYSHSITFTLGKDSKAKQWNPAKMPLAALIDDLCKHKIGPKDGTSIILADMVPGQRLKAAVKSITGIGLDIDNGFPTARIDEAVRRSGCLAVRYTTHSHFNTKGSVKRDELEKFDPDADIDSELLRRYFSEKKGWDKPIIETIEFVEERHENTGLHVLYKHAPMPKNRVMFFLKEPYVVVDGVKVVEGALDRWKRYPAALSALIQVPLDKACLDPSRLFYTPRHDKDKPFSISLFGGKLFDLSTLDIESGEALDTLASAVGRGGKSKTEEGKAMSREMRDKADGLQIATIIEHYASDKIRSPGTIGYNIECPFDEGHSNAGDANDTGCFAVDAAAGGNELCIVSCRHGSCQDYTFWDMIGKMVKDEWFEKSVLHDPDYDAIDRGDDPSEHHDAEGNAAYIEELKNDIASADRYDQVGLNSLVERIAKVSDLMVRDVFIKDLSKRTGVSVATVRAQVANAACKPASNELDRDAVGVATYKYAGAFDDSRGLAAIVEQVQYWNKDRPDEGRPTREPRFSCLLDKPVILKKSGLTTRFVPLSEPAFRSEVAQILMQQRIIDGELGPRQLFPSEVVSVAYHSAGEYLVPTPDLVRTPIIGPDGGVIAKNGWYFKPNPEDPARGINIYVDTGTLRIREVSKAPTYDELQEAAGCIRELLGEFHFRDRKADGSEETEPSNANAVAMLITPFIRRFDIGLAPLFLIEKPTAGSGASTLADLVKVLFEGAAKPNVPFNNRDEAEFQKTLVSMFEENRSVFVLDNVKHLTNPVLVRALTETELGGRILGQSQMTSRPNKFTWIATAINPHLSAEMARRCCVIRLDPKVSNIQKLHYSKNVVKWAAEHRSDLIWSILTLFRYWFTNGRPKFSGDCQLKSYDAWVDCVGGILETAGIPGFLKNPKEASVGSRDSDLNAFARELYGKLFLTPLAFQDIRAWAENECAYSIAEGRTDLERARSLELGLHDLDGRTLEISGTNVQLTTFTGQNGLRMYRFVEVCAEETDG